MLEKVNQKFNGYFKYLCNVKNNIKIFFYGLQKNYKAKRHVQLVRHNFSIIYVGLKLWLTEAKDIATWKSYKNAITTKKIKVKLPKIDTKMND